MNTRKPVPVRHPVLRVLKVIGAVALAAAVLGMVGLHGIAVPYWLTSLL